MEPKQVPTMKSRQPQNNNQLYHKYEADNTFGFPAALGATPLRNAEITYMYAELSGGLQDRQQFYNEIVNLKS